MIALWVCTCGERFESARESFLHRDGSDFHQVSPAIVRDDKLSGIEKQELQTEIRELARAK
jgi:hypothetical protein